MIRACDDGDRGAIFSIINAAAERYRGVIPPDRWHEPYMSQAQLDGEVAAGVRFSGFESDGRLLGIMGIQSVRDVDLIRHAYVTPEGQGSGVGRALVEHLRASTDRPLLVGTWAAAEWAIRFYERNGFVNTAPARKTELLRTYWDIPERQVQTSVVLVHEGA